MTSDKIVPELKRVLGAMLFGSRQSVSVADMRRVLTEVAEAQPEEGKAFGKLSEADVAAALEQLRADLAACPIGLRLVEVAGGFRFQTDAECGPWLRHLLDIGKPARLSRPTLETLAIIAYRQPVTRAEIEGVRGVTVDTIVRNLLELQLIRIVGRSPLPGRPLLLGTTQLFLEHFGLKDLKELPGIEQLCRKEEEYGRRARPAKPDEESPAPDGEPAGQPEPPGETPAEQRAGEKQGAAPAAKEDLNQAEEDEEDQDEDEEDEYDEDDDDDEDDGDDEEDADDEGQDADDEGQDDEDRTQQVQKKD